VEEMESFASEAQIEVEQMEEFASEA